MALGHKVGHGFAAFDNLNGFALVKPLGKAREIISQITDARCFHGDTFVSQSQNVNQNNEQRKIYFIPCVAGQIVGAGKGD
jgi:hypothetical protein